MDEPQTPSSPKTTTAHSSSSAGTEKNFKMDDEEMKVVTKNEEDESRAGAFPSRMPRLRGLQKNREDALEALGGSRMNSNNTTSAGAHSQQHHHQQQQHYHQQQKPPPTQRTKESPRIDRKQQKSKATKQQQQKEEEQFDVMDIVRKRAINANQEEPDLCHQEVLLMPQPPPEPTFSFDSGDGGDQAPLSDVGPAIVATGAFAGAPGEGLHRRDNVRFSLVGIHPPGEEEGINSNNNNNSLVVDVPVDYTSTTSPHDDGDDALAEAMPVEEDDGRPMADMEARPYDIEEAKQKKLEQAKRQQEYYLVLVLVFVCIIVGVILFAVSKNQKKDSKRTPSPVFAPSTTAPTDSPSSAPSDALDLLMESIPEKTMKHVHIYGTPQYKAWDWLSHHPNISSLEEWQKKQLFALAAFFYSFEGENWNQLIRERWMDYKEQECQWFSSGYGAFCPMEEGCDTTDHPDLLFASGEYMPLPKEYQIPSCNDDGEFTSLFLLDLRLSGFSPSIPAEIALLTSLHTLNLSWNGINASLSDMLPSELAQLTNLTEVQLWSNNLNGVVPTELGLMTSLEWLDLNNNALTGQLPSELGLMTSMRDLWLEGNKLNGLFLQDNFLTGAIPAQLIPLFQTTKVNLRRNGNFTLPTEIGLLTTMTELKLSGNGDFGPLDENDLTGRLPSELGLMTSLSWLELFGNALTGSIPSELGLISGLTSLELFDNDLTGQLPSELGLMTNITSVDISENGLTGQFPSELGLLTSMEFLFLQENDFTGRLPSELGMMNSLGFLALNDNSLSGSIPSELGVTAFAISTFLIMLWVARFLANLH